MTRTTSRRVLLASVPAALLAACQGTNGQAGLALAVQDVSTIATGLLGVLPNLATLPGINIPANTLGTVGTAIGDLQSVAAKLSSVASATAAQPLIQQVEADVNTVVDALAAFPIPPPYGTAIQAAAVLLPIVEAAVGMVVNNLKASAKLGTVRLTSEQARAALRAVAR